MPHSWLCLLTFSAVVVQIWAALDSGAMSRLCSRAITSAAMLFATCPLMNGLTGSVLARRQRQFDHSVQNHRRKRSFSCQQDTDKERKRKFMNSQIIFGSTTSIGREKSRMQTEGFTWQGRNSSPCKWKFVQSSFCPQWTSHCCSLG